ncbi:hypothetical protein O9G_000659 [Rozella allomycis CSF55]|uniref:Uncharacterized protein n=1 Tax=Rozella allomycis (strain CSF55) TaxID=988480 RepID=A0A075B384_ROZAC|nr:hypothetical protein O9G_000659 [Rozella allomycis CSF55]|eukprot:EPZ35263.1 hypothetical protein O9G_000659 [Rozella allomycis CSF55]
MPHISKDALSEKDGLLFKEMKKVASESTAEKPEPCLPCMFGPPLIISLFGAYYVAERMVLFGSSYLAYQYYKYGKEMIDLEKARAQKRFRAYDFEGLEKKAINAEKEKQQ